MRILPLLTERRVRSLITLKIALALSRADDAALDEKEGLLRRLESGLEDKELVGHIWDVAHGTYLEGLERLDRLASAYDAFYYSDIVDLQRQILRNIRLRLKKNGECSGKWNILSVSNHYRRWMGRRLKRAERQVRKARNYAGLVPHLRYLDNYMAMQQLKAQTEIFFHYLPYQASKWQQLPTGNIYVDKKYISEIREQIVARLEQNGTTEDPAVRKAVLIESLRSDIDIHLEARREQRLKIERRYGRLVPIEYSPYLDYILVEFLRHGTPVRRLRRAVDRMKEEGTLDGYMETHREEYEDTLKTCLDIRLFQIIEDLRRFIGARPIGHPFSLKDFYLVPSTVFDFHRRPNPLKIGI